MGVGKLDFFFSLIMMNGRFESQCNAVSNTSYYYKHENTGQEIGLVTSEAKQIIDGQIYYKVFKLAKEQ